MSRKRESNKNAVKPTEEMAEYRRKAFAAAKIAQDRIKDMVMVPVIPSNGGRVKSWVYVKK